MHTHFQFCLALVLCSFTQIIAQKKIKTLTLSDQVIYATVDRPGDLYVVTRNNQIQKFDIDGKLLTVYKNPPPATLFDPRDGARLFAYFRQDQHYSFLSPSFEITSSYSVDSSFAIEPWLMCISGDHNVWILDASDLSLKKVNTQATTVEVDTKIPNGLSKAIPSYTFIREYQGFLFLLDQQHGIAIFSSMGKWLKTIERPGLSYFNFIGEELYYLRDGKVVFFNLFTAETREITPPQSAEFVLITDERIYAIKDLTITIYTP
ncbi:MAG: hypothetical protein C0490_11495 [Marivirga sp.]|nr:hypothetical protein [Marivirga sp.]